MARFVLVLVLVLGLGLGLVLVLVLGLRVGVGIGIGIGSGLGVGLGSGLGVVLGLGLGYVRDMAHQVAPPAAAGCASPDNSLPPSSPYSHGGARSSGYLDLIKYTCARYGS